jgi:hypothetical protein
MPNAASVAMATWGDQKGLLVPTTSCEGPISSRIALKESGR